MQVNHNHQEHIVQKQNDPTTILVQITTTNTHGKADVQMTHSIPDDTRSVYSYLPAYETITKGLALSCSSALKQRSMSFKTVLKQCLMFLQTCHIWEKLIQWCSYACWHFSLFTENQQNEIISLKQQLCKGKQQWILSNLHDSTLCWIIYSSTENCAKEYVLKFFCHTPPPWFSG